MSFQTPKYHIQGNEICWSFDGWDFITTRQENQVFFRRLDELA